VEFFAAGAGDDGDEFVVVVQDAQGGVVDFDGDNSSGVTESDLDFSGR
jgi:hypothetical protein